MKKLKVDVQSITFFSSLQWPIITSMITMGFDKDELGKVMSVEKIFGALAAIASGPIYKKIYNATLASFPATFILFTAALYILAAVVGTVVGILRILSKS